MVMIAFAASLPKIFNLKIIVLFYVFLFSIMQTTLFSGKLNYCEMGHLGLTM